MGIIYVILMLFDSFINILAHENYRSIKAILIVLYRLFSKKGIMKCIARLPSCVEF